MKRLLAIGIILLFIGMSISSSTGLNLVKKSSISLNGKTLYVGGSGPNNYTKIQDAIDDASDGDTVFVYNDSSPYFENIVFTLKDNITLIGEDKKTTIIDGNFVYPKNGILVRCSNYINISGFTITKAWKHGILIENGWEGNTSNWNRVTNCIIQNNGWTGVYLERNGVSKLTRYNQIEDCDINNNDDSGIWIVQAESNLFKGNNISSNQDGIQLYSSSNNIIANNSIFSNRGGIGILLWYSNDNTITCNNISNNEEGIGFWESSCNAIKDNNIILNEYDGISLIFFSNDVIITNNNILNNGYAGIYFHDSSNPTINGNNIQNNSAYGIELRYSNDTIITDNNIILNNWGGIRIRFSSRNNITGNNITSNNGEGILLDSSNHNLIFHNNLINNNPNAYDECSNIWDNGYPSGGNFWNDYNGPDIFKGPNQDIPGSDGIGDIPYNISGGMNQDRYPLVSFEMEPPQIYLIKPVKGHIYLKNKKVLSFFTTIIIGKIDIIINAIDNQSGINKIELYINNELKTISNKNTLYWTWKNKVFFRYEIKTVVYDNRGNNATKTLKVWKFL